MGILAMKEKVMDKVTNRELEDQARIELLRSIETGVLTPSELMQAIVMVHQIEGAEMKWEPVHYDADNPAPDDEGAPPSLREQWKSGLWFTCGPPWKKGK